MKNPELTTLIKKIKTNPDCYADVLKAIAEDMEKFQDTCFKQANTQMKIALEFGVLAIMTKKKKHKDWFTKLFFHKVYPLYFDKKGNRIRTEHNKDCITDFKNFAIENYGEGIIDDNLEFMYDLFE